MHRVLQGIGTSYDFATGTYNRTTNILYCSSEDVHINPTTTERVEIKNLFIVNRSEMKQHLQQFEQGNIPMNLSANLFGTTSEYFSKFSHFDNEYAFQRLFLEKHCGFAKLKKPLPTQRYPLSYNFKKWLAELPEEDGEVYDDFIEEFGTHYVYAANYGGLLSLRYASDKNINIFSSPANSLYKIQKLGELLLKGVHEKDQGKDCDKFILRESYASWNQPITCDTIGSFVNSIHDPNSFEQVSILISPITNLLKHISQAKRGHIKKAISRRYAKFSPQTAVQHFLTVSFNAPAVYSTDFTLSDKKRVIFDLNSFFEESVCCYLHGTIKVPEVSPYTCGAKTIVIELVQAHNLDTSKRGVVIWKKEVQKWLIRNTEFLCCCEVPLNSAQGRYLYFKVTGYDYQFQITLQHPSLKAICKAKDLTESEVATHSNTTTDSL